MPKNLIRTSLLAGCLLLVGSASALAVNLPAVAHDNQQSTNQSTNTAAEEHKALAQARLDTTKLKVCQLREKHIDNIMQRISQRGSRQIDVINKIAERTEAFYAKSGKTLSDYQSLVDDVSAKKAAAQQAVEQVSTDKANFQCDGSDPKGAAAVFQADLKKEISALKYYKTSVKNLIVGVKSVQGSSSSGISGDSQ